MPGNEAILRVRVPKAVNSELDKIAQETGRKKSELVREAVIALIGMYRNVGKA